MNVSPILVKWFPNLTEDEIHDLLSGQIDYPCRFGGSPNRDKCEQCNLNKLCEEHGINRSIEHGLQA